MNVWRHPVRSKAGECDGTAAERETGRADVPLGRGTGATLTRLGHEPGARVHRDAPPPAVQLLPDRVRSHYRGFGQREERDAIQSLPGGGDCPLRTPLRGTHPDAKESAVDPESTDRGS